MYRIACWTFSFALLLTAALEVRADIVIGTIDFNDQTPLGIQRFDDTYTASTGTHLTAGDIQPFSHPISEQFALPFGPTDVAVSPEGVLYASDISGQILRVDALTGAAIPSPFEGGPDGLFTGYLMPVTDLTYSSLAFGPNGLLYVVDSYDTTNVFAYGTPADDGVLTPGVRIFDTSSGFQVDALLEDLDPGVTPPSPLLSSVAFTPSGNVLLSDTGGSRIYQIDHTATSGEEVVTELITGLDIDGVAGPDPFYPSGMAIDQDTGEIYVANLGGNNILRFDADGSNASLFATIRPDDPADLNEVFFTNSHNPTDIVFDREGNLLVSVLGDKNLYDQDSMPQPTEGGILRFDRSGNLLQVVAEGLLPASGIALVDDLLPGDYDGSGTVDQADYLAWKAQFGSTTTASTGADGNGDGLVDLADYTVWRNTLGATGVVPAMESIATSIPEPRSVGLAALVGLCAAVSLRKLTRPE